MLGRNNTVMQQRQTRERRKKFIIGGVNQLYLMRLPCWFVCPIAEIVFSLISSIIDHGENGMM